MNRMDKPMRSVRGSASNNLCAARVSLDRKNVDDC
jgi:hypothetical protein